MSLNFSITPHAIRTSTAIVHLEYDPSTLDPVPSPAWTRFVCISDTHTHSFDVPPGDVLLHSGDLTNLGSLTEFQKTVDWLYELPHRVKIVVAGNHDLTLDEKWYEENAEGWHGDIGKQDRAAIIDLLKGPRAVAAGIVYLQDEEHTFQVKEGGRTWSVYGSPWSPYFFNWAFNYHREDGPDLIAKFPKTDILLTHGPASSIFDRTTRGDLAGCSALRARLPFLRPRIHVAGHIHEARGAHIHAWTGEEAPSVQIDNRDEEEDEEEDENELGVTPPAPSTMSSQTNIEHEHELLDVDRTVFVNAANFPSGKYAWRDALVKGREEKRKVPFGGPGFQGVVVDLRD